jgi:hypothetical protein
MKEKLIMKTRIALLFAVASLLAGGVAAEPATKPLDPDKAPIASVDRFSDKAAHLQLRTPDNHIPGHNQPVDFDSGPFITQGLSPTTGKPVRYYNFDVQTTTPAPVYVLYREGEDKPVAGQLDIIDTLPGDKGYNDFRQAGTAAHGPGRSRCRPRNSAGDGRGANGDACRPALYAATRGRSHPPDHGRGSGLPPCQRTALGRNPS